MQESIGFSICEYERTGEIQPSPLGKGDHEVVDEVKSLPPLRESTLSVAPRQLPQGGSLPSQSLRDSSPKGRAWSERERAANKPLTPGSEAAREY